MSIVEISRRAKNDLFSIWEWGKERYGLDNADAFIDDLNATFEKIADIPYGYTARPELTETMRSKNFRKAYTIFYEPIDNGIRIVRVLRGSQDVERIVPNS